MRDIYGVFFISRLNGIECVVFIFFIGGLNGIECVIFIGVFLSVD